MVKQLAPSLLGRQLGRMKEKQTENLKDSNLAQTKALLMATMTVSRLESHSE